METDSISGSAEEGLKLNIPAASASPAATLSDFGIGDSICEPMSPEILAGGLVESQVLVPAAPTKSMEATRLMFPALPLKYPVLLLGGLGGGVRMRHVLAKFPVK